MHHKPLTSTVLDVSHTISTPPPLKLLIVSPVPQSLSVWTCLCLQSPATCCQCTSWEHLHCTNPPENISG